PRGPRAAPSTTRLRCAYPRRTCSRGTPDGLLVRRAAARARRRHGPPAPPRSAGEGRSSALNLGSVSHGVQCIVGQLSYKLEGMFIDLNLLTALDVLLDEQ